MSAVTWSYCTLYTTPPTVLYIPPCKNTQGHKSMSNTSLIITITSTEHSIKENKRRCNASEKGWKKELKKSMFGSGQTPAGSVNERKRNRPRWRIEGVSDNERYLSESLKPGPLMVPVSRSNLNKISLSIIRDLVSNSAQSIAPSLCPSLNQDVVFCCDDGSSSALWIVPYAWWV